MKWWLAATALALALWCGASALGARETSHESALGAGSSAVDLQMCVTRWNWMHFQGWFGLEGNASVPATVRAEPCRVAIDYRLRPSDPAYNDYLGTFFPCSVNRFGAYVCASHALGIPGDPARTGQNADYFIRRGRLQLRRPPARPVVTKKPDWVRRYRVDHSFIVPYDRRGRLRAGLTLRRTISMACETFANIPHPTTLLSCGAGLYCFASSLPVRDGERIACPTEPGARLFRRGRLRVSPAP